VVVRALTRLAQASCSRRRAARPNHPRGVDNPTTTAVPKRAHSRPQSSVGGAPGVPRARWRTHHMDVPNLRSDGVRAAPEHSLHVPRRSGASAHLQRDLIDTGGGPICVTRRTRNLVGACRSSPGQLSGAPNGQPAVARTKQPDRSETHQRWCSLPDRRRPQRFGHRPHTDQQLGIRTPDTTLCAYRLHRQWWPSVFLPGMPRPRRRAHHLDVPHMIVILSTPTVFAHWGCESQTPDKH
jgi:hypothetical protein